MNLALGTSDRPTAVVLATINRAEWLADFEARRSEANPAPVKVATPELARVFAARVPAHHNTGFGPFRFERGSCQADAESLAQQTEPLLEA